MNLKTLIEELRGYKGLVLPLESSTDKRKNWLPYHEKIIELERRIIDSLLDDGLPEEDCEECEAKQTEITELTEWVEDLEDIIERAKDYMDDKEYDAALGKLSEA